MAAVTAMECLNIFTSYLSKESLTIEHNPSLKPKPDLKPKSNMKPNPKPKPISNFKMATS